MSLGVSVVYSFHGSVNTPLYEYATICLFVLLLMDISVYLSTLGLLKIKICECSCVCVCAPVCALGLWAAVNSSNVGCTGLLPIAHL